MLRSPRSLGSRALLIGLAFLVCAALIWFLPVRDGMLVALQWVEAHPAEGKAGFLALFIVATVLMVPGSLLVMAGGFLFGVGEGIAIVSVAVTLGGTAALFVSRYLGRGWFRHHLGTHPRLVAIDRAIASRSLLFVLLTRLSLALPYNLLNYLYGLTSVPLRSYVAGTWLGMLPAVALYVYLGAAARDLDELLRGEAELGAAGPWLMGAGFLLALLVVVLLNRTATRLLQAPVRDHA